MSEITEKDKASPAYRKMIKEENTRLKKSLKVTQDQSSVLQEKVVVLEKENAILRIKIGSPFMGLLREIAFIFLGIGLSEIIGLNFIGSAFALVVFAFLILFYLALDRMRENEK